MNTSNPQLEKICRIMRLGTILSKQTKWWIKVKLIKTLSLNVHQVMTCQLQKWKHHQKPIDNLTGPTIMGDVEPDGQKAHGNPTKETLDWFTFSSDQESWIRSYIMNMRWVGSKQDINVKKSNVGNKCKVSVWNKPGMLRRLNPSRYHLHNPSKTSSKWSDPNVRENQYSAYALVWVLPQMAMPWYKRHQINISQSYLIPQYEKNVWSPPREWLCPSIGNILSSPNDGYALVQGIKKVVVLQ